MGWFVSTYRSNIKYLTRKYSHKRFPATLMPGPSAEGPRGEHGERIPDGYSSILDIRYWASVSSILWLWICLMLLVNIMNCYYYYWYWIGTQFIWPYSYSIGTQYMWPKCSYKHHHIQNASKTMSTYMKTTQDVANTGFTWPSTYVLDLVQGRHHYHKKESICIYIYTYRLCVSYIHTYIYTYIDICIYVCNILSLYTYIYINVYT